MEDFKSFWRNQWLVTYLNNIIELLKQIKTEKIIDNTPPKEKKEQFIKYTDILGSTAGNTNQKAIEEYGGHIQLETAYGKIFEIVINNLELNLKNDGSKIKDRERDPNIRNIASNFKNFFRDINQSLEDLLEKTDETLGNLNSLYSKLLGIKDKIQLAPLTKICNHLIEKYINIFILDNVKTKYQEYIANTDQLKKDFLEKQIKKIEPRIDINKYQYGGAGPTPSYETFTNLNTNLLNSINNQLKTMEYVTQIIDLYNITNFDNEVDLFKNALIKIVYFIVKNFNESLTDLIIYLDGELKTLLLLIIQDLVVDNSNKPIIIDYLNSLIDFIKRLILTDNVTDINDLLTAFLRQFMLNNNTQSVLNVLNIPAANIAGLTSSITGSISGVSGFPGAVTATDSISLPGQLSTVDQAVQATNFISRITTDRNIDGLINSSKLN